MKRVEDMNQEELLALTDTEIEKLHALEYAFEGVIPTDKPAVVDKPECPKDVTVYSLTSVTTTDEKLIDEMLALVALRVDTLVHVYYSDGVRRDASLPSKQIEQGSWQDTKAKFKREEKHALTLAKTYEDALSFYNKQEDKKQDVDGIISELIYEAKKEAAHWMNLETTYKHYLELSENQPDIAKKFFIKAYDEDTYTELGSKLELIEEF